MQIDQAKFSRGLALIANRGMRITVGRAAAEDAVTHVRDVAQAWLDDRKDSGPAVTPAGPRPNDGDGGQLRVAATSGQTSRAAAPSPNDREGGQRRSAAQSGQIERAASRSPIGDGEGQNSHADKANGGAPSPSPSQQDARGQRWIARDGQADYAPASSPINGRAGASIAAPARASALPPRPAVVPRPVPVSAARKAVVRAADAHIMRGLKDTFEMHDGRPIGDLRGQETERYKRTGLREAAKGVFQAEFIHELEKIGGIVPADSRYREVYSDAVFEKAYRNVKARLMGAAGDERAIPLLEEALPSLLSGVA